MTYDKNSFLSGIAVGRQLKGWGVDSEAKFESKFSFQMSLFGFTELWLFGPDDRITTVDMSDFNGYKEIQIYDDDGIGNRMYRLYPTYIQYSGWNPTGKTYYWRVGCAGGVYPAPVSGRYRVLPLPAIANNIPPTSGIYYYVDETDTVIAGDNLLSRFWNSYISPGSTGSITTKYTFCATREVTTF